MPRILLSNDDGIAAPGLIALYRAICDLGDIHVVAPAGAESGTSHAITFDRPISVKKQEVKTDDGRTLFEGHAVYGRPADCVKLALTNLFQREHFDVVISGMNAGANIGINVFYSGTVAAAREAALLGLPAIAMSLHIGDLAKTRWEDAAGHARGVIERILKGPIEPRTVINVNIPILDDGKEPRGLRVVPISTSPMDESYHAHAPDTEGAAYQLLGGLVFRETLADTDVHALFERYITLTPLHYDPTHHEHVLSWIDHLDHPKRSADNPINNIA